MKKFWYFDWPWEIKTPWSWVHASWRIGPAYSGERGWRFFGIVHDDVPKCHWVGGTYKGEEW